MPALSRSRPSRSFLDYAEVSAAALRVHRRIGVDRTGGAPIQTSAFERAAPRLRITGDRALPGGARAVLVRVEGRWVITYDRALDDAARRFHIAHEIGHLVQCLERDVVVASYPCGTAASIGERWCDAFAAELLVPQPMLDRAVGDAPLFPSAPIDRIAWENFVDHLHGGAGFNVPREVMLQQLRLLAAARAHLAAAAFDRLREAGSGRGRRRRGDLRVNSAAER